MNERRQHHPVRIAPLPREQWSDEAEEAISILPPEMQPAPGQEINSLSVLARHPDLARADLAFSLYLRFGATLTARERELLILRTAWLLGAEYELLRHARLARRAGMTEEELVRISEGSGATGWDPADARLLRAAEECCRDFRVGDATRAELAEHYSDRQIMDVLFTIGSYVMRAIAFNSIGVEPEADLPPFPTSR